MNFLALQGNELFFFVKVKYFPFLSSAFEQRSIFYVVDHQFYVGEKFLDRKTENIAIWFTDDNGRNHLNTFCILLIKMKTFEKIRLHLTSLRKRRKSDEVSLIQKWKIVFYQIIKMSCWSLPLINDFFLSLINQCREFDSRGSWNLFLIVIHRIFALKIISEVRKPLRKISVKSKIRSSHIYLNAFFCSSFDINVDLVYYRTSSSYLNVLLIKRNLHACVRSVL